MTFDQKLWYLSVYDISEMYHLFAVEFRAGRRLLGRNLSKVQIFGVEFGAYSGLILVNQKARRTILT